MVSTNFKQAAENQTKWKRRLLAVDKVCLSSTRFHFISVQMKINKLSYAAIGLASTRPAAFSYPICFHALIYFRECFSFENCEKILSPPKRRLLGTAVGKIMKKTKVLGNVFAGKNSLHSSPNVERTEVQEKEMRVS